MGQASLLKQRLQAEPPVVRIRHLNHHFGEGETRKQVLVDNNLELLPGEIVIMTGPSGSGKTTLLTLIGALRTVQEGSVQILGQELSGRNKAELVAVRRNIGFIFQAHNLFESLTAYQNVKTALDLRDYTTKQSHDRIIELLTQLGLEQRIYYKPGNLSGGQRQRVAIARALANRPRLILADEPTAALDKESGRHVVNLLRKLAREERCTSLIVTHDNRILDVADRIVNMVDGSIISNVLVEESVTICQFLSKCAAFSALTPATLADVAEKMTLESYEAGKVIIRQGDEGDKFYLIRHGSADVYVDDGTGKRWVRTMGEGEFFGEAALMTGEPRSATVTARQDLDLYTLSKENFKATLEASAPLKEQLGKVLFQRQ
jgi:putative ABC transport system ATP-binding protein